MCRNDQVRKKVNDLLATGASYAMVLRALAADNAELDEKDQVTIDSIRNHCARHFPVQNVARAGSFPVQQVAKATYRDILERRAKENAVDFVEGVMTIYNECGDRHGVVAVDPDPQRARWLGSRFGLTQVGHGADAVASLRCAGRPGRPAARSCRRPCLACFLSHPSPYG